MKSRLSAVAEPIVDRYHRTCTATQSLKIRDLETLMLQSYEYSMTKPLPPDRGATNPDLSFISEWNRY
jgi:hypothetical protein